MLRQVDDDMVWVGDFTDDVVGTGTNGNTAVGRYVYQKEDGLDETAHMISGYQAGVYYGGKSTFDPDGAAGRAPPFGFGTEWCTYGVPLCWENYSAGV